MEKQSIKQSNLGNQSFKETNVLRKEPALAKLRLQSVIASKIYSSAS